MHQARFEDSRPEALGRLIGAHERQGEEDRLGGYNELPAQQSNRGPMSRCRSSERPRQALEGDTDDLAGEYSRRVLAITEFLGCGTRENGVMLFGRMR